MKLISVFSVALGLILSGCISKPHRHMASVQVKPISEYADYTMANTVSNRSPASTGSVELSAPTDNVLVTMDVAKSFGDNTYYGNLVFSVKNQPAIAGQLSGTSAGGVNQKLLIASLQEIREKGIRPAAVPAVKNIQTQLNGVAVLPADQRSEAIQRILLDGRDQLLVSYSDLAKQ